MHFISAFAARVKDSKHSMTEVSGKVQVLFFIFNEMSSVLRVIDPPERLKNDGFG